MLPLIPRIPLHPPASFPVRALPTGTADDWPPFNPSSHPGIRIGRSRAAPSVTLIQEIYIHNPYWIMRVSPLNLICRRPPRRPLDRILRICSRHLLSSTHNAVSNQEQWFNTRASE